MHEQSEAAVALQLMQQVCRGSYCGSADDLRGWSGTREVSAIMCCDVCGGSFYGLFVPTRNSGSLEREHLLYAFQYVTHDRRPRYACAVRGDRKSVV